MVKNYKPEEGKGKWHGKNLTKMRAAAYGDSMDAHLLRVENKMEFRDGDALVSAAEKKRQMRAGKAKKLLEKANARND